MSDHYCCKRCGQRYDDCTCPPLGPTPDPLEHPLGRKVLAEDAAGYGAPPAPRKTSPDIHRASSLLADLLDGGWIDRYHVRGQRMLVRQSVAEHSWRVAMIVYCIEPEPRPQLIMAALCHDISERVTGDIPANVKRANPEIERVIREVSTNEEVRLGIRFDLLPNEMRLLSWADRFEGALHCWNEVQMGNTLAVPTLSRYLQYASDRKYVLESKMLENRRRGMFNELNDRVQQYLGDK